MGQRPRVRPSFQGPLVTWLRNREGAPLTPLDPPISSENAMKPEKRRKVIGSFARIWGGGVQQLVFLP